MEQAPRTRFSTATVAPARRIAYWKDAICEAFVRLELECEPQRPFSSRLAIRHAEHLDLIDVAGSPQTVRRSERLIRDDSAERHIIMWQRAGEGAARQGGSELRLQPGALAVLDSRRPYELHLATAFRQTVVKAPIGALEQRLGASASFVGRPIDAGSALGRLAGMAFGELADAASESRARPLATAALDLLALALAESRACEPALPRMSELRVRWAKAHVLENLRDPALSPQQVAARQGVSLRLLQRLFAREDADLSHYILEQRLLHCRESLRQESGRTITEVALAWGFNDAGRFAKAFRRRFGISPSQARHAFAQTPQRVR